MRSIDAEKEKEIEQLQNRCFVLSRGVTCIFCGFDDCKHKNNGAETDEIIKKMEMRTRWERLSLEAGEANNPWDGEHKHWAVFFSKGALHYWDHTSMKYEATHFPSEESLKSAIAELSEENVKKYILGVIEK